MNTNLELGYHPIAPNYGYFIDKIPPGLMQELGSQINEIQNNFNGATKAHYKLVGEIQHEYELKPQTQFKYYTRGLTQQLENASGHISTLYKGKDIPILDMDDLWVNFQQKHEYNPPHRHAGLYSFVIWYQIPYTTEDEAKYNSKPEGSSPHGNFSFLAPVDDYRNIWEILLEVDKSKEGYVAMFPSSLYHMVYPFYSSDEYRITVAGNVQPHE